MVLIFILSLSQKKINMKKVFLFLAGAALFTACGNKTEETASEAVVANYTLDVAASSLAWTGEKTGPNAHSQSGTLSFTDGSVETTNDVITSGTFTIDMNSLKATSVEGEQAGKLEAHLKSADFFDVANNPSIKVKVGELKDGKIATTITVLGADFTQDVPVTTSVEGDVMHVHGDFKFNVDGINSPAFDPADEERVLSDLTFKLHLELKK